MLWLGFTPKEPRCFCGMIILYSLHCYSLNSVIIAACFCGCSYSYVDVAIFNFYFEIWLGRFAVGRNLMDVQGLSPRIHPHSPPQISGIQDISANVQFSLWQLKSKILHVGIAKIVLIFYILACGILASWLGIEPMHPSMEGSTDSQPLDC